ncbi:SDR family NAD(P)-dependent oxidoreductase [Jatrophihabitans fulvus]
MTERKRVCVLTGAGGRLGAAFCRAYAAQYDILAVCHRRGPAVPSQHERFVDPLDADAVLPENEASVYALYADLEQDGQVQRVVDVALARYGRVDLLVNNAAVQHFHPAGLLDPVGSFADAERFFRLNVVVPAQLAGTLAHESWRHRADENRAANANVVNISSTSGSRVYGGGQAVYASSKAALNHMTRHLAAEFAAFGVRANAVAPGAFPAQVATETVAAAIARLDREDVTGKVLIVE